jgi:hypothetical protein
MTSNFKIQNFIEVEIDGRTIDLHNNFSFIRYSHNTVMDELIIYFHKSTGNWVPPGEFDRLTFTLSKIHYLKTSEPDPELLADDHCLSGITYYYPDDREENFGYLDRELPEMGDDIIFTFQSDRVIRANCDNVTLKAEWNS